MDWYTDRCRLEGVFFCVGARSGQEMSERVKEGQARGRGALGDTPGGRKKESPHLSRLSFVLSVLRPPLQFFKV